MGPISRRKFTPIVRGEHIPATLKNFKHKHYNFFYYYQLETQISCSFTQITLIKILYISRAQSAHHPEVHDANCTYATSGIVIL